MKKMNDARKKLREIFKPKSIPKELEHYANDDDWVVDKDSQGYGSLKHKGQGRKKEKKFDYLKIKKAPRKDSSNKKRHKILQSTLGKKFVPDAQYHEFNDGMEATVIAVQKSVTILIDIGYRIEQMHRYGQIQKLNSKEKELIKKINPQMNAFIQKTQELLENGYLIDLYGPNNLVITKENKLNVTYLDSIDPIIKKTHNNTNGENLIQNLPQIWEKIIQMI
jgi:hypothetical protein